MWDCCNDGTEQRERDTADEYCYVDGPASAEAEPEKDETYYYHESTGRVPSGLHCSVGHSNRVVLREWIRMPE